MKSHSCSMNQFVIVALAAASLVAGATAQAGASPDYIPSRAEINSNARLVLWRAADFGTILGLSLSIDGIPIITLSRGEGYEALVRPGSHVLSVTDTPSPYGKTKFTHRRVTFRPGETYAFTAMWEVETILLEPSDLEHIRYPLAW